MQMETAMNKSEVLRGMLGSGDTLVMPDAYDAISARIIEHSGFKAIQCSGYSISIAACYQAETDLGLAENVETTRKIVNAVNVPVMADAEDGYGDPKALANTVREFIRAGAAGANIEDLIPSAKRECKLVDEALMVEKIIAAREATAPEGNPNFIINARTDALRAFDTREIGLKEAIKRANRYMSAGADLAFICYTATLDEVKLLRKEVNGPISIAAGQPYNIREFTIDDLREQGVARVSLPTLAILSSIHALMKSVSLISRSDGFAEIDSEGLYCSQADLTALLRR